MSRSIEWLDATSGDGSLRVENTDLLCIRTLRGLCAYQVDFGIDFPPSHLSHSHQRLSIAQMGSLSCRGLRNRDLRGRIGGIRT